MLRAGTPTSVKSGPVDDKRGDAGSLPPSAKAARYGRGAFDNESVLSEAIIEEEPKQGMFESTSQEQETTAGVDGWAGDDIGHAAPAEDGWDLDASALDNLPLVSQGEQSGPVGEPAHSDVPTSRPGTEAEKAGEAARIGQTAQHLQGSLGQLQPTWLGDLPQPDAHSAGFAFDTSVPIPKVPSGVGVFLQIFVQIPAVEMYVLWWSAAKPCHSGEEGIGLLQVHCVVQAQMVGRA